MFWLKIDSKLTKKSGIGLYSPEFPKYYFLQIHSKWDLVGYSGDSPGLENAVKSWGRPIRPICISVYFDTSPCFSPTSEFTGLSIEAKCKPMENARASP